MNRAEAGAGPLLSLMSRQNKYHCKVTLTGTGTVGFGGLPTARIVPPMLSGLGGEFRS
jgi:hypothetical protein